MDFLKYDAPIPKMSKQIYRNFQQFLEDPTQELKVKDDIQLRGRPLTCSRLTPISTTGSRRILKMPKALVRDGHEDVVWRMMNKARDEVTQARVTGVE